MTVAAGETTERFDGEIERTVLRARTTATTTVASAFQGESESL